MPAFENPVVQRHVIVSILGIDNNADATYTYTAPITGEVFIRSEECRLQINRPTVCLFLLDADASANGWTISHISGKPDGVKPLPSEKGPYGLSLATYNDHSNHTETFNYYIHFFNTVTEARFKEDPQEQNIPPR